MSDIITVPAPEGFEARLTEYPSGLWGLAWRPIGQAWWITATTYDVVEPDVRRAAAFVAFDIARQPAERARMEQSLRADIETWGSE